MKTYLVGGAVRDSLLNLPIKDKDYVVVGAEPAELLAAGYTQVGKGFPVFLHPTSKQEFALARLERKTAPGHTGFELIFSKDVTLEEDLSRRDLTINAIAQTETGELIDPYGGQQDIQAKLLRHVSPAFIEDPLRVLRVARFAARFAHLGFTVAPQTLALMQEISRSGEIQLLPKERLWSEIELAMKAATPAAFVSTLKDCGALEIILPEVMCLFGVPQPAKYHPEVDTGLHILLCLEQAAKLTPDPVVRYAVLVHDVGKGITDRAKWPSHAGHETLGRDLLDGINKRLKVPNEYAALAAMVCEHHTKMHRALELKPSSIVSLLEALDGFRRPERFEKFLLACEADARGRTGLEERVYPQHNYLRSALSAASAVDARAALASSPNLAPQDVIRQARLDAVKAYVTQYQKKEDNNA
ncbi:MAG: tRNA nucleotidyltransferase (CCA-adding enzyme) [Pseudohongiellaceae bacterium]|jgi:tRNA nucleotidyltransferase (CCA-adding enzyme)